MNSRDIRCAELDIWKNRIEHLENLRMSEGRKYESDLVLTYFNLEGNQYMLMDSIMDHKTDGHAVLKGDQYVYVNGRKSLRRSTKGWHLCIKWKDGSTSWERLVGMKESYPVEVAEYSVARSIDQEPAYEWWARHFLKKRDRIIAAVAKRYHKITHKFGIRVPKSVEEAKIIDDENGNTLWQDAMKKEMDAVRVAFKILHGDEKPPPTY